MVHKQKRQKVLFICIHNSARSQMAEAFLNFYGHEKYLAQSAGLEPGKLNPNVVKVMSEIGLDISHNQTNSVNEFLDEKCQFDLVITVCDAASAEKCPVFPIMTKRIAWFFKDPSTISGNEEQILQQTRLVRDEIKNKILNFINETE